MSWGMEFDLPADWAEALKDVLDSERTRSLARYVDDERKRSTVFPPPEDVFAAFKLTPLSSTRVVILGQDPYHDTGQAHGLCFSVKPPTKPPPSLKNIFKELEADLGLKAPPTGDLTSWAQEGVLLLNTILTVRAHEPMSHKGKGWEAFTDAAIAAVNNKETPVVFCLWGNEAKKKKALIDADRHIIVEGAHPSPLSARGFFGSRPFSAINTALDARGVSPLSWRLESA